MDDLASGKSKSRAEPVPECTYWPEQKSVTPVHIAAAGRLLGASGRRADYDLRFPFAALGPKDSAQVGCDDAGNGGVTRRVQVVVVGLEVGICG